MSTTKTVAVQKPKPSLAREPLSVQVVTRVTPTNRARIKSLADSENISLQALGVYAWNLALTAYGLEPIADSGE